jgi:hypothetical protein
MAEEIDLRFLSEQIEGVQRDVTQVKSGMAQMPTYVCGELSRFEDKLVSFREHFEARFDQQTELIKSEVKNLCFQISNPKKN